MNFSKNMPRYALLLRVKCVFNLNRQQHWHRVQLKQLDYNLQTVQYWRGQYIFIAYMTLCTLYILSVPNAYIANFLQLTVCYISTSATSLFCVCTLVSLSMQAPHPQLHHWNHWNKPWVFIWTTINSISIQNHLGIKCNFRTFKGPVCKIYSDLLGREMNRICMCMYACNKQPLCFHLLITRIYIDIKVGAGGSHLIVG